MFSTYDYYTIALDIKVNSFVKLWLSFHYYEYRHESNAVSLLNYHFVFIPKRRKKVLVGAVAERLQQIICELVVENRWKIIAMEIMPDHVHLFLNVKPIDEERKYYAKNQGKSIASSEG